MEDHKMKSSDFWAKYPWENVASSTCTLVALVWVGYTIVLHTIHYNNPQTQRYIIRILIVCPIYAISSWFAIIVPEYALQSDTIREVYEAWVMYSFLSLVLEYSGGEANCINEISTEEPIPWPWPVRLCKKPRPRDGRMIRFSKRGTLQFVFLKPFMATLSLAMQGAGLYWTPEYQLFLFVVYNFSYSLALYSLVLFYTATKKLLKPRRPLFKFLAIKSLIFATFWQSLVIAAIPNATPAQSIRWNDLFLSIEMVPFAIILSCAFGVEDLSKLPDARWLKNIKDVFSVKDVVQDTYHNFMPTYREYVLQSASQPGAVTPIHDQDSSSEAPSRTNSTSLNAPEHHQSAKKTVRLRTFLVGNLDKPEVIKMIKSVSVHVGRKVPDKLSLLETFGAENSMNMQSFCLESPNGADGIDLEATQNGETSEGLSQIGKTQPPLDTGLEEKIGIV